VASLPLFRRVEIRPTTHEEDAGAAQCGAGAYRDIDRPRAILNNTHTRIAHERGRDGIRSAERRLLHAKVQNQACGFARGRSGRERSWHAVAQNRIKIGTGDTKRRRNDHRKVMGHALYATNFKHRSVTTLDSKFRCLGRFDKFFRAMPCERNNKRAIAFERWNVATR